MTSPSTAQASLDEEAIQRPRPRLLLLAPVLAILLIQAVFQLLAAWTTFRLFGAPGRIPQIATIFAVLNLVATVGLVSGRRTRGRDPAGRSPLVPGSYLTTKLLWPSM